MAYQPPLLGNKMILNFKALSWPRSGAYLMFLGNGHCRFLHFIVIKKSQMNKLHPFAACVLMLIWAACEIKPQEIVHTDKTPVIFVK